MNVDARKATAESSATKGRRRAASALRVCAVVGVSGLVAVAAACAPPPGVTPTPPDPTTVTVDLGGEAVTVSVAAGLTLSVAAADLSALPPEPVDLVFPLGAIDLQVGNVTPGAVVRVTVTLENPVTTFRKTVDGAWDPFAPDGTTGGTLSVDGQTIVLDIQDGGRGDDDGVANGVIVDALGPARPWLAGACLDSSLSPPYGTDGLFNGIPNVADNTILYASYDGSCTGSVVAIATFVRAATQSQADLICAALGKNPSFNLAGAGITAPVDSWGCLVNIINP